jgi:hypothetical protein
MTVSAHKARIYHNSGTHATPTYANWAKAREISPDELKKDMNESGPRSRDFKGYSCGRKDVDLAVMAPVDNTGDSIYALILDAWWNDTEVYLASVSGDIVTVGTVGYRGYFHVESVSEPKSMDGGYFVTFKFKPSENTQDIVRLEITA